MIAFQIAYYASIGIASICAGLGALLVMGHAWALSIPFLLIALALTWMVKK